MTSDLQAKADVGQTFYIGTTQVAINRASAGLTLAGITLTAPDIGAAIASSMSINGGTLSHTIAGATVTSLLEVHSEGVADAGALTIHRHTDTAALGANLL